MLKHDGPYLTNYYTNKMIIAITFIISSLSLSCRYFARNVVLCVINIYFHPMNKIIKESFNLTMICHWRYYVSYLSDEKKIQYRLIYILEKSVCYKSKFNAAVIANSKLLFYEIILIFSSLYFLSFEILYVYVKFSHLFFRLIKLVVHWNIELSKRHVTFSTTELLKIWDVSFE